MKFFGWGGWGYLMPYVHTYPGDRVKAGKDKRTDKHHAARKQRSISKKKKAK